VLLLQRDDDAEFWQSVTGTLEAGESALQTAYREVEEETGIKLSSAQHEIRDCHRVNQYQIRSMWQHRYAPGTSINTEYVFAVQINTPVDVVLSEHLSYEWLTKQQAIERVWSETNREAIQLFVPDPK
jgi:dATP pyrophosphohydrolase